MTIRAISRHLFIVFMLFVVSFANTIFTYDNAHFYRAHFFYGEPRFEQDYLTSFDFTIGGGSTCKAKPGWDECGGCCNAGSCHNCTCCDVCLLDYCGRHNMQYLGKNVPKDLMKQTDLIMHQLEQIPSRGGFGTLSFSGKFKTWEMIFNFQQNFARGFFLHAHMPFRKLDISCVQYKDVSCNIDESCSLAPCPQSEAANTYWQAFLNLFPQILADHNLSIANTAQKGVGDTSIALGYTINHEDTDFIDFIDATVRFGVLIPTAKKKNEHYVFSLPLGYNGHTGVFACFDGAFGIYDWVTLGIHVDAMWFNTRCRTVRIKTACEQHGLIKLGEDTAKIKMGNLYNAGLHFKADHFVGGLSLIVGYSYSTKQADTLSCFKNPCTDCSLANSDCALQKWDMHTFHLFAEYDFAKDGRTYCPRINAFYNVVIGGKRIFKTNIGGGGIGVDFMWN